MPQVWGLVGSTLMASTEAGRVPLKGPTYWMVGKVLSLLLAVLALDEGDEGGGEGCGRRSADDGVVVVVVVVDCDMELLWNHSQSRYLHVKSPSLPWEIESPQTRILTVFVSGLEAIAAGGELLSVPVSGTARPLVRGTTIMAAMAERNAEARILPRRMCCLMSHITSNWQLSMYARKWAISSIVVDRELGRSSEPRPSCCLGGGEGVSKEEERGIWLAAIDDPERVPCWKAGSSRRGLGRMRHQDSCVYVR